MLALVAIPAVVRLTGMAFAAPVPGSGVVQAPHSTVPPTRTPAPTATAVSGSGVCTVTGEQSAAPAQIEIRQTVGLGYTLHADCPEDNRGRSDILLLFDNSNSMRDLGKIDAAKAAVRQFIDRVDFNRHRVGLAPFSDSAYVAQPLTFNRDFLVRALNGLAEPNGGTNIAAAITLGDNELLAAGRRVAVPILVLLTDGRSSAEPMFAAAARARARGVVLFAVGLGADAAQDELRAVASSPEHYYFAPGPEALAEIYTRIANLIREVMITDVVIRETLDPDAAYVDGTGSPRAPLVTGGRELAWAIPFITGDATALGYEVRVGRAGRVRPSQTIWVDYADGDGTRRQVAIAPAEVEVVVPETRWIHLPVAWNNQCLPSPRGADIVLAIDSSSSMTGAKLDQAVAAARQFVDQLDLRLDRAAVVRFDSEGELLQPLTRDRAAIERALGRLALGTGTRLDRAILVATETAVGLTPSVGNRPVIVLLSDGRQTGAADSTVHEAARQAQARGVAIYAIGLGDDVDRALLLAIAGNPARTRFAPQPEDLVEIYRQLAGVVGCK